MMAKPQMVFETNKPAALGLKWCAQCGGQYWMVTPESAAAIACVDALTIYEWAYRGKIHSTESGDEEILVCLNSL
jgi:hypothetical protein